MMTYFVKRIKQSNQNEIFPNTTAGDFPEKTFTKQIIFVVDDVPESDVRYGL